MSEIVGDKKKQLISMFYIPKNEKKYLWKHNTNVYCKLKHSVASSFVAAQG